MSRKGAVVLYILYNKDTAATLMAEATLIMSRARDKEAEDSMNKFPWVDKAIPAFAFSRKVPNLPGQDTQKMQKMPWRMKDYRKALHIICAKESVLHVQALMEVAKKRNLVAPIWGPEVHPSNVIVTRKQDLVVGQQVTKAYEIQNIKSFTRRHVNFHECMIPVGFPGIWDLDIKVNVLSVSQANTVVGQLSLRDVMYSRLNMSDGYPLIAELHQPHALVEVEGIVPNTPEAEQMVAMMAKNVAAYLHFYLQEEGLGEQFIKELMEASCDPALVKRISLCSWDKGARALTTPEDEEEAKRAKLEEAAWYNDAFGAVMDSPIKKGKNKKTHLDPEDVYKLGDDHSVKSIHKRPGGDGKGYGGSPGVPTFQVGGKQKEASKARGGKDGKAQDKDKEDDLNLLSKSELIQRLAQLTTKQKGSAPESGSRSHSSTSDSGDNSSTNSELSSSTDSSEESSAGMGGTDG